MFRFFRPYRPDPFRFRPALITPWLYPLFWVINFVVLKIDAKIQDIQISPEDLQRLKSSIERGRLMIISNHVNFIDPHIQIELMYRLHHRAQYLAGIEPFDGLYGIAGWLMQRSGAMSIDRGVLDRYALEAAQKVLDNDSSALVIYPEGEASYSNPYCNGFFPGATAFALSTAEKLSNPKDVIQIIPVAHRYYFSQNSQNKVIEGYLNLVDELCSNSRNHCVLTFESNHPEGSWEWVVSIIKLAHRQMEVNEPDITGDTHGSLIERLLSTRNKLLAKLMAEHLPDQNFEGLDEMGLMSLKNRLRSIIARKRYAPERKPLEKAITRCQSWLDSDRLGALARWQISQAEREWIGSSFKHLPEFKRLKQLKKHLSQQVPYMENRETASVEDLRRWEKQINDTRRVKMLTLLTHDIERQDISINALDETLTKLEILHLSAFRYRGPKHIRVRVGEALDVKKWVQEHGEDNKKRVADDLNQTLEKRVQGLLETLYSETP